MIGMTQLLEAYSNMDPNVRRKCLKFIIQLDNACDMLIESAKQIQEKTKFVAKEKQVAKITSKEFAELGLVSIRPRNQVPVNFGVYNTKTPKIGKYIATNIDPNRART